MEEIKIPEIKDPMKAIRGVMLVTALPFILYMFLTNETPEKVPAKVIYERAFNSSYSGRISEKEHNGNHSYKFRLNTGRSVYISGLAYDATEVGDSVWKKSKHDTLYIKMPDGAVLAFDEVSDERQRYNDESSKKQ